MLVLLLEIALGSAFAQEQSAILYVKLSSNPSADARVRNAINLSSLQSMDGVAKVQSLIKSNPKARKITTSNRLRNTFKLVVEPSRIEELKLQLQNFSNVMEVVEEPRAELLFIPDDSLRSNQDYLTLIQAFEAWDVTTGSDQVVIGVSDNGVDYNHEDLKDNHFFNESDPVDGLDNDGNGYVDDYIGVDIADSDNDPDSDLDQHGSAVAGISSATTNNSLGISGVGYHSKYFPIKVFRSDGSGSLGTYESIVYAAELGLDVVNLSWGSVNEPSEILQDVIDYAVLDHDMVVIAAAGNTDEELNFHPASYQNVLSIGASTINDEKADFGTYSYHIDLMAPGFSVYSTRKDDSYGSEAGSSFAAPQVSGAAALIKDVFPELSAIQIMERLRMTSDDIYDVGNNMDYYGQLGKGRLNVFRAVSEENVASVRCYDYSVSGPFDQQIFFGDTVQLNLNFVNWLRPVSGLEVNITSLSSDVEILNDRLILGSAFTFDSIQNQSFTLLLSENTPTESRLIFRLEFSDSEGYDDFQYVEFTTSPGFVTLDNGKVEYSVGSNGSSTRDFSSEGAISSMKYNSVEVSNYTGLIVGTHADSISDNIVDDYGIQSFSDDFQFDTNIKLRQREDIQQFARNIFNDSLATNIHGLKIEQELMSWEHVDSSSFLITEYFVTNFSNDPKVNLNFGYYVDFDLGDSVQNFCTWDAINKLGYTYGSDAETTYAGVAILTSHAGLFHGIDLFDIAGDPIDFDGSWDESEKYDLVSTEKLSAGGGTGNDVGQVVTAQVDTLHSGSSAKIAFALVFGSDSLELVENTVKAIDKYNSFLQAPDINWVVTSCANVDIALENENSILLFSDPLGMNLVDSGENITIPGIDRDSTLFYREQSGSIESDIYGLKIQISQPEASFRADPDTLFLGDSPENRVQFVDTGIGPVEWFWDFGNGSFATLQNPRAVYDVEGTYTVTMSVNSEQGCENEVSEDFVVQTRGEAPLIDDQSICAGETATLAASNSSSLRFYNQPQDEIPFFEGAQWTSGILTETVSYYVSSTSESVESAKIEVTILVDPIVAMFHHSIDTLDFSSSQLLLLTNQSENTETIEWQINNLPQGNSESFTYDYSGLASLEMKLIATSGAGCQDSLIQTIELASSPNAGVNEIDICAWRDATVRPVNGEIFVYYSDEELTDIVAKGSEANFEDISYDTSFYVTNVSNYLESEGVVFDIRVIDHDPQILVNPDSLELANSRMVTFSADPQNLTGHRWFLNDVLVETVSSPTLILDTLGLYDVQLISENAEGCVDTAYLDYLVYEVLGLVNEANGVSIFPVPAQDELNVSSADGEIVIHSLHNVMGQSFPVEIIKQGSIQTLSLKHLSPGLYIISGEQFGQAFQTRFVKK